MSLSEGLEALRRGDFATAATLLEQAAKATGYASDEVNHAYTLALRGAGDSQHLADAAFNIGNARLSESPGMALDYFQRAITAGLDAERARQIGALHEQWARLESLCGDAPVPTVLSVAHVVGGLQRDTLLDHVQLLVDALNDQGIGSTVHSTEWASAWFDSPAPAGQPETVDIEAQISRAPAERDLLERARAVANAVRAEQPDVVLYHSAFFEQVSARVAAFHPAPLQVHVNHGREMDTDIFDGRIHGSKRALAQTRYPAKSASWIALASDIEKRMSAEAPIPRRSIGLDSAASVSATFGDLDQISGSGYVNALIEILVRFPNHCHLFAGKGNVRAMRQSMHAEGVLPRVRFLGEMSNVAPLLDGLDFYLAPFPNFECGFVLDAMGAGKPVVIQRQSSDPKNGCGSDLVADDDLVVDSVGGYVEAVSRIIRKTDLRKRVSEAVRQRFHSEYSPQRLAQRHLEYFKEIASRV